jgi:heme/copper-type cytochrome/quinol oxidase subunit 2
LQWSKDVTKFNTNKGQIMSGLDDLAKKISELLDKAAHATSWTLPQAWKLLIDYQKATALASITAAVFQIILVCVLSIIAYRLIKFSAASYKKAQDERYSDPVERATVVVPMLFAIMMTITNSVMMYDIMKTLPLAIAQHYYPDSFAAQQLIQIATDKK